MNFKFFDSDFIYRNAEENGLYDMGDNLLLYDDIGFSHKWIQPPVACYFLCTEDQYGNANMAPISMGTAVWGEPPGAGWFYTFAVQNSRQTMVNIDLNKECVLSYFPSSLIEESSIAAFPIPRGISEMEVARLTPLLSKKVKPAGVKECPVNLETKIVKQFQVANTTIFISKVVGVHVREDFVKKDMEHRYHPGVFQTDLLYEVSITKEGGSPKLNYAKMDLETVYRPNDNIGDKDHWIGDFTLWMKSELERGNISLEEHDKLVDLNNKWLKDTDPVKNSAVKNELTKMLSDIIWRKMV